MMLLCDLFLIVICLSAITKTAKENYMLYLLTLCKLNSTRVQACISFLVAVVCLLFVPDMFFCISESSIAKENLFYLLNCDKLSLK